jgi:hypothetical protein
VLTSSNKSILTVIGIFLFCGSLGLTAETTETFFGEARSEKGLAYTEKHIVRFDDLHEVLDAETTYYNPSGELICLLKSDFRKSLTAPDHTIEDKRTGNVQGLRRENTNLIVFYRDKGKPEACKNLSAGIGTERIAFGCQGLNYYLVKNLQKIKNAKSLPIKFIIPGNLDAYNFEIRYLDEEKNGTVLIDIEIDNWLLKIFAPKLEVRYDQKNGRILWYKGLSNIKDAQGKPQSVTINYLYDTP